MKFKDIKPGMIVSLGKWGSWRAVQRARVISVGEKPARDRNGGYIWGGPKGVEVAYLSLRNDEETGKRAVVTPQLVSGLWEDYQAHREKEQAEWREELKKADEWAAECDRKREKIQKALIERGAEYSFPKTNQVAFTLDEVAKLLGVELCD